MKAAQQTLSGMKQPLSHGGGLAKGKRKSARPVVTKKSMHVVLRSEMAFGKLSLLQAKNAKFIDTVLARKARQHRVRVESRANSGNHLHLLVRAETRDGFRNFLRDVTGKISQFVTGAKKGNAFGRRFWTDLAFSRVVQPGRDWKNVVKYVFQNQLETVGVIRHQPRAGARRDKPFLMPWEYELRPYPDTMGA